MCIPGGRKEEASHCLGSARGSADGHILLMTFSRGSGHRHEEVDLGYIEELDSIGLTNVIHIKK